MRDSVITFGALLMLVAHPCHGFIESVCNGIQASTNVCQRHEKGNKYNDILIQAKENAVKNNIGLTETRVALSRYHLGTENSRIYRERNSKDSSGIREVTQRTFRLHEDTRITPTRSYRLTLDSISERKVRNSLQSRQNENRRLANLQTRRVNEENSRYDREIITSRRRENIDNLSSRRGRINGEIVSQQRSENLYRDVERHVRSRDVSRHENRRLAERNLSERNQDKSENRERLIRLDNRRETREISHTNRRNSLDDMRRTSERDIVNRVASIHIQVQSNRNLNSDRKSINNLRRFADSRAQSTDRRVISENHDERRVVKESRNDLRLLSVHESSSIRRETERVTRMNRYISDNNVQISARRSDHHSSRVRDARDRVRLSESRERQNGERRDSNKERVEFRGVRKDQQNREQESNKNLRRSVERRELHHENRLNIANSLPERAHFRLSREIRSNKDNEIRSADRKISRSRQDNKLNVRRNNERSNIIQNPERIFRGVTERNVRERVNTPGLSNVRASRTNINDLSNRRSIDRIVHRVNAIEVSRRTENRNSRSLSAERRLSLQRQQTQKSVKTDERQANAVVSTLTRQASPSNEREGLYERTRISNDRRRIDSERIFRVTREERMADNVLSRNTNTRSRVYEQSRIDARNVETRESRDRKAVRSYSRSERENSERLSVNREMSRENNIRAHERTSRIDRQQLNTGRSIERRNSEMRNTRESENRIIGDRLLERSVRSRLSEQDSRRERTNIANQRNDRRNVEVLRRTQRSIDKTDTYTQESRRVNRINREIEGVSRIRIHEDSTTRLTREQPAEQRKNLIRKFSDQNMEELLSNIRFQQVSSERNLFEKNMEEFNKSILGNVAIQLLKVLCICTILYQIAASSKDAKPKKGFLNFFQNLGQMAKIKAE